MLVDERVHETERGLALGEADVVEETDHGGKERAGGAGTGDAFLGTGGGHAVTLVATAVGRDILRGKCICKKKRKENKNIYIYIFYAYATSV